MSITSHPNFNKNVPQKKIKKLSKKEKEKLIKSTKKIFDKIDKEDLIKKIFNKQMLERKANGLEVMTFEQWKKQNKEFGRLVKND
jgi:hypothetical protein|tara:strand:+ start:53 stop:307 length:255 start_codon:yes stop_codon:yes gene_type:complete